MSYSHFPLGVKCLKTSVSVYWTPLISQMIIVCHWLHHNSAWTLIVKSTKYLLYVYSVAQLCPILCDSMDCSLPGSSVCEIFQTRILEWVAISSSRESSQTRDRNLISHVFWIGRRILYHCTPLQHSCLENPTDGGAWWAAVHGVAKSRTVLSDFTFTFHFHAMEKEMSTHSSVLAWRIPGTGEPGGLPSMGSHRVRHDWSD